MSDTTKPGSSLCAEVSSAIDVAARASTPQAHLAKSSRPSSWRASGRRLACLVVVVVGCSSGNPGGDAESRPDIEDQPRVVLKLSDPKAREAEEVLNAMISSERAFDPATSVFYADDASVVIHWTSAGGDKVDQTIPGIKYKRYLNATLAAEKEAGHRSRYADFVGELEDRGVRVRATRYEDLDHTSTSISWLIARDHRSRAWRIFDQEGSAVGKPIDFEPLDKSYAAPAPSIYRPTPTPDPWRPGRRPTPRRTPINPY